jgi:hypothetical protein
MAEPCLWHQTCIPYILYCLMYARSINNGAVWYYNASLHTSEDIMFMNLHETYCPSCEGRFTLPSGMVMQDVIRCPYCERLARFVRNTLVAYRSSTKPVWSPKFKLGQSSQIVQAKRMLAQHKTMSKRQLDRILVAGTNSSMPLTTVHTRGSH